MPRARTDCMPTSFPRRRQLRQAVSKRLVELVNDVDFELDRAPTDPGHLGRSLSTRDHGCGWTYSGIARECG